MTSARIGATTPPTTAAAITAAAIFFPYGIAKPFPANILPSNDRPAKTRNRCLSLDEGTARRAGQPRSTNSLRNPPTRSNTPPGARGLSLAGFRISSFVNPDVTSPVRARAVHQDGGTLLSFVPRFGAGGWRLEAGAGFACVVCGFGADAFACPSPKPPAADNDSFTPLG